MHYRRGIHPVPLSRITAGAAKLTVGLILVWGKPQTALAHGDVHLGIHELTLQIEKSPGVELYLKRGDLYRLDANYPAALSDLEQAEELAPGLSAIRLCLGRTHYEARQYRLALPPLNQLLARCPDHPDGTLLRARTHAALGDHASAVRDFDHLIVIMASPSPDTYLERAGALVALGRSQEAIRSLDEGIARAGNLQSLQQAALRIELAMSRYDDALSRVGRTLPTLQRKEFWQARQGEIFEAAGRHREAGIAFTAALASIESLPAQHRAAKPVADLEAGLRDRTRSLIPEASKTSQPHTPKLRPPP